MVYDPDWQKRARTVGKLAAGLVGHVPTRHGADQLTCACDPHLLLTEQQWCLHAAGAQLALAEQQ